MAKGLWDDYDDSTKVDDQLPNLLPGDYLVLMQDGKEFTSRAGQDYLKLFGTVLVCTEDLGSSSPPLEEVGIAIFRDARYNYFEKETKAFVKAAKNMEKDEANALTMLKVKRFLVGTKKNPGSLLPGRVLEIKVREVAAKKGDDGEEAEDKKKNKNRGPLCRVTPVRALTRAEVKEVVPVKVLKKVFPKGPGSMVEPTA